MPSKRLTLSLIVVIVIAAAFIIATLTACSASTPVAVAPAASPTVASSPTPMPTLMPTSTPLPTATPIGGGTGRIAFVTNKGDHSEINLINADGTELTQLAVISGNVGPLTWSSDGEHLGFTAYVDGRVQAHMMKGDGSNLMKYEHLPTDTLIAVWSLDFQKIAFVRGMTNNAQSQVYVMNVDGSGLRGLAPQPANYLMMDWSPDGTQLAFAGGPAFVSSVDESRTITVTPNLSYAFMPSWSPDGQNLATVGFVSGTIGVHMTALAKADDRLLASWPLSMSYSVSGVYWAPDSRRLVFAFGANKTDGTSAYLLTLDGAAPQLIMSDQHSWWYDWSPDGRMAVVSSDQDGKNAIYLMDLSDHHLKRLTEDNHNNNFNPPWQPRGKR